MVKIPPQGAILRTLKNEHPRLLLNQAGFDEIGLHIKQHAIARKWFRAIKRQADAILDEPVTFYDVPDGQRLLMTSRQVVNRLDYLGLVYRLTGDKRYAKRGWREMQAVAKFPNWGPMHFLDNAEMTHAMAIGYDWLHDALIPKQQVIVKEAIVNQGLRVALDVYENKTDWWPVAVNNWNQVCNGGIASGALAIADEEPELAEKILHHALNNLPIAMKHWAPDGGWYEGPMYWGYATMYNVMILAALESTLGTTFGLADMPGMSHCGDFPMYMTGATGEAFNFADSRPGRVSGPQLYWLAKRYNRPEYAALQHRQSASSGTRNLVWFKPELMEHTAIDRPLDRLFSKVQVASMRSDWDDPDAAYVAIKAGRNGVSHDNLDLGSFIYEVNGIRWAADLGSENYNLPGYWSKAQRYTYYRIRAEGHNTFVINPSKKPDQQRLSRATFTRFTSKQDSAIATVDLTSPYRTHVKSAARTFKLDQQRIRLHITDKITMKKPSDFWWFMHTQAKVAIRDDGKSATLTLDGNSITVTIARGPSAARFTLMDPKPLPTSPNPKGQNPNDGSKMLNAVIGSAHSPTGVAPIWGKRNPRDAYRKLAIHLTDTKKIALTVTLAPSP